MGKYQLLKLFFLNEIIEQITDYCNNNEKLVFSRNSDL